MNATEFCHRFKKSYNLSEIKELCQELQIDYEELAGDTKTEKVYDLLRNISRQRRLAVLLNWARQARPQEQWPVSPLEIAQLEQDLVPQVDHYFYRKSSADLRNGGPSQFLFAGLLVLALVIIVALVVLLVVFVLQQPTPTPSPPLPTQVETMPNGRATETPTSEPSQTPIPPSATPTLTPTVTETAVPTATPTMTATLKPTQQAAGANEYTPPPAIHTNTPPPPTPEPIVPTSTPEPPPPTPIPSPTKAPPEP